MKTQIIPSKAKLFITKAHKAFSLVELLVVIAVIGIIAAIAIPNIAGITGSANVARDARNAQNIASVYAAAIAAGHPVDADTGAAIAAAVSGISVTNGSITNTFAVPNVVTNAALNAHLNLTGGQLVYTP